MGFVSSALSAHGGFGYLAIHALQFGAQPLLAKRCVAAGTPTSSLVLGAELAKVMGCLAMLHVQGDLREVFRGWNLRTAILVAGLPSLTYLVQNFCIQVAYQKLDGVVFNVLNQSKMPFTAIFSFLIMSRPQSRIQCLALLLVTMAGTLVSLSISHGNGHNGHNGGTNGHNGGTNGNNGHHNGHVHWALGINCIVAASCLSGLGSGLTEWILQGQRRNTYLFSAEMAIFGSLTILFSLVLGLSPDAEMWRAEGLFSRWTPFTLVPVLTQGLGGIVVGLITKVAGGVKKGFAVICGLLFTAVLKCFVYGEPMTPQVCLAIPLVAGSIFLHAKYPPEKKRVE